MVKTLSSLHSLSGKTAILRLDTDVDIRDGKILDDTRLQAGLESLKILLDKGAGVNIIGHLGRPLGEKSSQQTPNSKFSLKPVAEWFGKELSGKVESISVGTFVGFRITDRVILFENIRYYEGEEENDKEFAKELSLLGDIYVNDAFAVSHRAHASIVGVAAYIPSYAGVHLEKEIEELGKILKNPKRPLHVIIGGAKIETKLPMVEKMHSVADYILVGGEIAEQTRTLLKVQHEKVHGQKSAIIVADVIESGFDITPKSRENFKQILERAATIVWNGPVGLIDLKDRTDTEVGTRELAEFIVNLKAYKIIGGGDTLSYLNQLNLLNKFDFVSTGGGAMLEFLAGKKLPGIEALEK